MHRLIVLKRIHSTELEFYYVYTWWISAFKKLLLQLCFCDCFPLRFIFYIQIFINGERKMQRSKDPALSSLLILELYQGYTEQPCFKP